MPFTSCPAQHCMHSCGIMSTDSPQVKLINPPTKAKNVWLAIFLLKSATFKQNACLLGLILLLCKQIIYCFVVHLHKCHMDFKNPSPLLQCLSFLKDQVNCPM